MHPPRWPRHLPLPRHFPTPLTVAPSATAPSFSTPAPTPSTALPPSALDRWLRDHAITFATVEPTEDFADLQPLKRIIGDARLVSLGEATHGTHEFQAMKHRLIRFLVTEMGFTDFAMEANLPECAGIDDYVQGRQGDLAPLLRGLYFWTWDTEEVRDMVEWMRAHNATPEARPAISFHGFDMQYISVAMDNVLAYLRRVDLAAVASARSRYILQGRHILEPGPVAPLQGASPGDRVAFLARAQAVYAIWRLRERDTCCLDPDSYSGALQNARIVVQGVDTLAALGRKDYGRRDA